MSARKRRRGARAHPRKGKPSSAQERTRGGRAPRKDEPPSAPAQRPELPAWARATMLASAACVLFLALSGLGTRSDPYAPNDWLFSHVHLAETALEQGRIPMNRDLLHESGFEQTNGAFREETGLDRMTFYATTTWHFWNGLPLHPSLLATLSALTGLPPEETARLPLGGLAVALLVYASADLLLARRGPHGVVASLAPFALVLGSTPLLLDLRVLMPSVTLVVLALLLHLLLRRLLLRDAAALPMALAALALLPFWYYTVSYFVILLFVGFLFANVILRLRGSPAPPLVPMAAALLVPLLLGGLLALNGALTSHVQLADSLGALPFLGSEAGSDYESRLNRSPWRSGILYTQTALLFAPLVLVSLGAARDALRRRQVEPEPAALAHWSGGGALFSLVIPAIAGVSFLNRSVIYLAPLAALAFAWWLARSWDRRWARRYAAGALAVGAIAAPLLVDTATPTYSEGDRTAFEWMHDTVPQDAVVYSSLEVASVLFRTYGFEDAIAFHPRTALLDDFWFGEDPEKLPPYLSSFEWFVLRDDVRTAGFEEFGPLRQPIPQAAYDKFDRSPDLHRVFDDGDVVVYQVHLDPQRFRRLAGAGPPGFHSPSESE